MAYSATQLQLTHVLQQLYRRLGGKVTLATGGSTTTVVDTKLADELADSNEDDIYNGGTVVVIEDAGGANAAPEGEFSRITDYVASTTTITFSPALTAAPASGDRVLIATPEFPLYDMIEVVNDALKNLGDIPAIDTSLTTAANQTEYTLPLPIKGQQILNIEMQGITTDANDNQYMPIPNWSVVDAAPGSTGTLVLPQLASGYTLRITYQGKHPRVDGYADYISEYLHPELVHGAVFAHALQWRNDNDGIAGGADQSKLALEQKAWSQYDRARMTHPIDMPKRRQQGFVHWAGTYYSEDNFYPIPKP